MNHYITFYEFVHKMFWSNLILLSLWSPKKCVHLTFTLCWFVSICCDYLWYIKL